jgi:hypothetical protein
MSKLSIFVILMLPLFTQCRTSNQSLEAMDERVIHEQEAIPKDSAVLPQQVYSEVWKYIVARKIPISNEVGEYNVVTKFFKSSTELHAENDYNESSPVYKAAITMRGPFYIINYTPKDFRILGGSYKVVVKSDDFNVFIVISGV